MDDGRGPRGGAGAGAELDLEAGRGGVGACRVRGIASRIARRGVEPRQKLGRHRWVVERTFAWLHRFRRLLVRHERRADIHCAFLLVAVSLICINFPHQWFCQVLSSAKRPS